MLEKFCKNYGLGSLLSEPQPVLGGLLHTMYRVETGSGVYAVKVLNPEIMQRPTALQNMIHSEQVAHALESAVHCAKLGQMLGTIHAANVQIEGLEPEAKVRKAFGWEELLENWNGLNVGKEVPSEGRKALEEFLPELLMLDKETVAALQQLSAYQVISHRDLDPKNVMW